MEKYGTAQHWSESQKEFIHVDAMALPYAKNVYRKLMRDDAENFEGSILARTLVARLCPTTSMLYTLLATKGEASYWIGWAGGEARIISSVRSRFYRVARRHGLTIETSLDDKKEFLIGRCEPVDVQVKVKRV